jgi:hypothetical protein
VVDVGIVNKKTGQKGKLSHCTPLNSHPSLMATKFLVGLCPNYLDDVVFNQLLQSRTSFITWQGHKYFICMKHQWFDNWGKLVAGEFFVESIVTQSSRTCLPILAQFIFSLNQF